MSALRSSRLVRISPLTLEFQVFGIVAQVCEREGTTNGAASGVALFDGWGNIACC